MIPGARPGIRARTVVLTWYIVFKALRADIFFNVTVFTSCIEYTTLCLIYYEIDIRIVKFPLSSLYRYP